jgi:hypothetical protein
MIFPLEYREKMQKVEKIVDKKKKKKRISKS